MEQRLSVSLLAQKRIPLDLSGGMHIYTRMNLVELLSSRIADFIEEYSGQQELHIPFTGFGYTVVEDGWFFEVAEMFAVYRLHEINQLEYLEDPRETPARLGTSVRFSHTRYRHSSNVCAIALAIAEVNREWFVTRPGYREALLVAALTHDTLTPAGGDTTKAIDRDGFDEDAQYHTFMTKERSKFLLKHGVNPQLCIETVEGKGVLGRILDIADKLAYVGHDFEMFAGLPVFGDLSTLRRHNFSTHLRKNLLFCKIWEDVRVEDDCVWFTDAESLTRFLLIRGLLFRQLYTHPKARYRDALLMYTSLLFLYEEGYLTRTQLLSMDDGDLRIYLAQNLNWRHDKMLPSQGHFTPSYRSFDAIDDAKNFEMDLRKQGRLFVRTESLHKVFKPAHHFQVKVNGTICTLLQAHPHLAKRIETAGQTKDPIRVSYLIGAEPNLGPLTEQFIAWSKKKLTQKGDNA